MNRKRQRMERRRERELADVECRKRREQARLEKDAEKRKREARETMRSQSLQQVERDINGLGDTEPDGRLLESEKTSASSNAHSRNQSSDSSSIDGSKSLDDEIPLKKRRLLSREYSIPSSKRGDAGKCLPQTSEKATRTSLSSPTLHQKENSRQVERLIKGSESSENGTANFPSSRAVGANKATSTKCISSPSNKRTPQQELHRTQVPRKPDTTKPEISARQPQKVTVQLPPKPPKPTTQARIVSLPPRPKTNALYSKKSNITSPTVPKTGAKGR
jgi:hypothetical protein